MDESEMSREQVVKAFDEMLSMDPPAAIEAARNGSFTKTQALANAIATDRLPSKYLSDVFQLADVSIFGISVLMPHLNRQSCDSSLARIYLEHWPAIVSWAHVFISDLDLVEYSLDLPLKKRRSIVVMIFFAAYQKRRDERFRRLLTEDSAFFGLVTQIWLIEGHEADYQSTMICNSMINVYVLINGIESLDVFLKLADGKADRVARLLLHRLSDAAHRGFNPLDLQALATCSHFMLSFAAVADHPVNLAMWKKKGVIVVLEVIAILSRGVSNLTNGDNFLRALEDCFVLLGLAAVALTNAPCILQSIQNAILKHLVYCSPVFSRFSERTSTLVDDLLSKFYTTCFIYPNVLSATEESFKDISSDLQKRVTGSKLNDTWRCFSQFFFERFIFKCYYDLYERYETCDNCGTRGYGREIQMTLKTKCQTEDWKTRHKQECKVLRQKGPDEEHVGRHSDLVFRHMMASHDVRRHLSSLRELASRKYPGVEFESLAINLDYSVFPPTLDVVPIEMFATQTEAFSSPSCQLRNEEIIKGVKGSKGKESFMKVYSVERSGQIMSYDEVSWTVPWFCSASGSRRKPSDGRSWHKIKFQDTEGNVLEADWDIADELMLRCGLTPDSFLGEGRTETIRKQVAVLEIAGKLRNKGIFSEPIRKALT
ncbi:hypothetical protein DFH11DRAFT_1571640 [Phellopilus nigrolimitatus]|nr:hypothetical protein DFH11DRAFT_1571640 [Phellopilus nigrolimitatus]